MNRTIILGGGITGLILVNKINNSVLMERDDKVASDFLEGNMFPKYIHANDETLGLYHSLKIEPKIKRFKIGILYENRLYDFYDETIDKKKIYEKYCIQKYGKLVRGKMNGYLEGSSSKFYIENKDELIAKLYKENKERIRLSTSVKKIYDDHIIIGDNVQIYGKIISTIPINIFSKLYDGDVKYDDLRIYITQCSKGMADYFKGYHFIYVVGYDEMGHRITVNNGMAFSESTRPLKRASVQHMFPTRETALKTKDILFIGRLATGDYSVKLEDVISETKRLS